MVLTLGSHTTKMLIYHLKVQLEPTNATSRQFQCKLVVGYCTIVMPSHESIPKDTLHAKHILGKTGL